MITEMKIVRIDYTHLQTIKWNDDDMTGRRYDAEAVSTVTPWNSF